MSTEKQGAATIVFARKLEPVQHNRYERWIGRAAGATSDFAGYGGTILLRPATPGDAYTAIVHFDTAEHLDRWLNSDERKRCLKDLETIGIESEEVTSLAGLDHWVSLKGNIQPPPRWKMAILILSGLYPLVLVDAMYLNPLLDILPWPVATLASLMVSVSMMVWIVLPTLSKLFGRWLSTTSLPSVPVAARIGRLIPDS